MTDSVAVPEATAQSALRVTPAPLPHYRLLRALPAYRWWKPLVALVLTLVLWVIFTTVVVIIGVLIAVAQGQITFTTTDAVLRQLTALFGVVNAGNPLSISIGLIGVATLLPATLLGYLIVGLRPVSVLRSVAFRLRWRWLAFCLLPALAITVLATLIQALVFPALQAGSALVAPTVPIGTFLLCAVIIVVVTPIQAAAEEFAFRGMITQMFGSWLRPAWLVIVLSAIPFAAAHTQYLGNGGSLTWATADVAVFALVAGFVTWRTGGIEASIALHAINNTVAFLTLASSLAGSTSTSSQVSGDPFPLFLAFLVSVMTMGLYAFWIDRAARRRGLQNRLYPVAMADTSAAAAGNS
ncbi:MAG: CPBP family intramembrane metalloprotease [Acidobacteria bacterium]|nr:CPBP family intramembrane metalloprotease [Acidobacteriota bacterium]